MSIDNPIVICYDANLDPKVCVQNHIR